MPRKGNVGGIVESVMGHDVLKQEFNLFDGPDKAVLINYFLDSSGIPGVYIPIRNDTLVGGDWDDLCCLNSHRLFQRRK